ncbi:hypothetical protein M427DRAFT_425221 [Gonapodya prolifera JEL478]|uniref:Uncharacterized protein n=1 Tax=Gonapodya prolifera (strain JEL478) TaxID=1344416 RepID=A0A139A4H6_GONPJ|nr:hypothetical protein M427DRAFT_425221 [Gonapodya prolifera JEL478]|eukprot:KXS11624.1 hypothetical protein M427DRAFT_425221 [Gonapodya prolifera JEL478]
MLHFCSKDEVSAEEATEYLALLRQFESRLLQVLKTKKEKEGGGEEEGTSGTIRDSDSQEPQTVISVATPPSSLTVECSLADGCPTTNDLHKEEPIEEEDQKMPPSVLWIDLDSVDSTKTESPENAQDGITPALRSRGRNGTSFNDNETSKRWTPEDLERKQQKAQELREGRLQSKTERIRAKYSTAEKSKARIQSDLDAHLNQLRQQMEERQAKAEKLKQSLIEDIRQRSFNESSKTEEVLQATMQSAETKKIEIKQKEDELEERLKELEDERQRKMAEARALQEAASERRKEMEEERRVRLEKEHERKKELEVRRQEERRLRETQRQAEKEAKARRIEEFSRSQESKEKERQRELQEKAEKAAKRYDERLEQLKEKAGTVVEHSKEVASRVAAIRAPENRKHLCLVCDGEEATIIQAILFRK